MTAVLIILAVTLVLVMAFSMFGPGRTRVRRRRVVERPVRRRVVEEPVVRERVVEEPPATRRYVEE